MFKLSPPPTPAYDKDCRVLIKPWCCRLGYRSGQYRFGR